MSVLCFTFNMNFTRLSTFFTRNSSNSHDALQTLGSSHSPIIRYFIVQTRYCLEHAGSRQCINVFARFQAAGNARSNTPARYAGGPSFQVMLVTRYFLEFISKPRFSPLPRLVDGCRRRRRRAGRIDSRE